ncbi:MAG: cytidylate kinase-like family protein [Bacteroidales bacterium]|nr:cytidylate kinase-like family protein [Bacteroidales bacterium]MBQ8810962.1 cytidylate kinase-like family protein [Bacteroidales bacterium]
MDKKIIITIGRQFGSGGKCVADALGAKLGIPVYDSELITKASQDSGFSAELFVQSDEKRRFFSLSSIFASSYSAETENFMSDKGLFKMQSETIRNIAAQGSAIIVGRCSDYILRDMEGVLDVFLTSSAEIRAKRVAERLGISVEKAADMIEHKDRSREDYYNYYTFGNWGVASTYDLCLDSSILGIEGTADFIIDFARKAGLI